MSLHFTEDEFQAAWRELDEPQVEGWELFTETMGVKIYRRYSQVGVKGKLGCALNEWSGLAMITVST